MTTIVKEPQEKTTGLPLFQGQDIKARLGLPVSVIAECTCSTLHMSVHDAMCPGCWTKLLERRGH